MKSLEGGAVIPPGGNQAIPQIQADRETDVDRGRPLPQGTTAQALERRARDVAMLRSILQYIHLPTIDEFFAQIQIGYCIRRIFVFWEGFHATYSSSSFHFYDSTLRELVVRFHDLWNRSLGNGNHFDALPSGDYKFYAPGDIFNHDQEAAFNDLTDAAREASGALRGLLAYVRDAYLEVDTNDTSASAWKQYLSVIEDVRTVFPSARP